MSVTAETPLLNAQTGGGTKTNYKWWIFGTVLVVLAVIVVLAVLFTLYVDVHDNDDETLGEIADNVGVFLNELDPRALCFDGTPAVANFHQSKSADKRWFIRANGMGVGCWDAYTCNWTMYNDHYRMSTLHDYGKIDFVGGIMAPDYLLNPQFWEANHIQLHYCSQDWYLGNSTDTFTLTDDSGGYWSHPDYFFEETIEAHFRGRVIYQSFVKTLVEKMGVSTANGNVDTLVVLFTDNAHATFLYHHDWLHDYLQQHFDDYIFVVDSIWYFNATYYPETPDYYTHWGYNEAMFGGWDIWKAQAPAKCVAELATLGLEREQECFFTKHMFNAGMIDVSKMFIRQNWWDRNKMTCYFGVPEDTFFQLVLDGDEYILAFVDQMKAELDEFAASTVFTSGAGAMSYQSCATNQILRDIRWLQEFMPWDGRNQTLGEHVWAWWVEGETGTRRYDCGSPTCNPNCPDPNNYFVNSQFDGDHSRDIYDDLSDDWPADFIPPWLQ